MGAVSGLLPAFAACGAVSLRAPLPPPPAPLSLALTHPITHSLHHLLILTSYYPGYGSITIGAKDMPVQVAAWENTNRLPLFDVPTAEALAGALHVCAYECFFSRWSDSQRGAQSSCLLVPPTLKESSAHSFCFGECDGAEGFCCTPTVAHIQFAPCFAAVLGLKLSAGTASLQSRNCTPSNPQQASRQQALTSASEAAALPARQVTSYMT